MKWNKTLKCSYGSLYFFFWAYCWHFIEIQQSVNKYHNFGKFIDLIYLLKGWKHNHWRRWWTVELLGLIIKDINHKWLVNGSGLELQVYTKPSKMTILRSIISELIQDWIKWRGRGDSFDNLTDRWVCFSNQRQKLRRFLWVENRNDSRHFVPHPPHLSIILCLPWSLSLETGGYYYSIIACGTSC